LKVILEVVAVQALVADLTVIKKTLKTHFELTERFVLPRFE
jgi:hypothetical protein